MKKAFLTLVAFLLLALAFHAAAQIPRTLSYQGVLTDNAGNSRPDGSYSFTFRFYTSPTGGTAIWSESKSLPVKNGLFSTVLGEQTPFGAAVKFDQQYWLGIQVGNEPELSPRIALTSVGYSFSSLRADTASVSVASLADTTWRHSGSNIYRQSGNVGLGTTTPSSLLHVNGGNLTIGDEADIARGVVFRRNGVEVGSITTSTGRIAITGNVTVGDEANIARGIVFRRNGLDVGSITSSTHQVAFSGASDGTIHAVISASGNVGIGTTNPTEKLEIAGRTKTQVLEITGGSDLAEPFEISESQPIPKGALVIIDEENPGRLKLSHHAYDKRVAGVVSGAGGINPGLTLTQEGVLEGGQNVALSGRVYALATAANGPIKPGDLLTTSERFRDMR